MHDLISLQVSSNDFVVFAAGSRLIVLSFVMHIPCHLVILVVGVKTGGSRVGGPELCI